MPPSALRGLVRDFTAALGQQMYFWGRDVIHPTGNLLCHYGFERRASEGLDGTSCYRMEFDGDRIELHGACVGRYSREGEGFLFVRNRRSCFLYRDSEPPAPGLYANELLRSGTAAETFAASQRFLDWWLDYEKWIASVTKPGYRDRCHQLFAKLPKSKPWLTPGQANLWLRAYATDPGKLRRAREWKREGIARS